MPRSSRHKSHKQSKHSSKDYSDSEEDVKMKEKSSKDENLVKVLRDSASGEKRKISSQVREGKEGKDLSGHGNGEASEDYFSSKRRKEKADAVVGGDRWNGGGEERGNGDRIGEKETIKGENSKIESRSKEVSDKGESLRIESKNRSKKYESVSAGERKEESLASVVVEKEDNKGKGESKRKSERDYSGRKDGKESKDRDRREKEKEKEKEKENKRDDAEAKLVDMDSGKKQGSQMEDLSEERQFKRSRENSDCPVQDEFRNPELEKELDKRTRRRRESPSDRGKNHDDFKEGEERGLSSRNDRAKDVKYRDDKHKEGIFADKYNEDGYKDDRKRDEKYYEETNKDNKHRRDNYREDGEKDSRRRDDRHREDGDRDNRTKDEKHREDGEKDTKRKDDKYREGTERDGRHRDDRHREDGEKDSRRRDERYREGDKDGRHGDERYYEDGDKEDRRRDSSYKEDGNRDNRHKEEKHREDIERESRHKDSKQGDESDREKRLREAKYRDERATRDRSGDKSDPRRSIDDSFATDRQSRKSSAYDDSPTHDDRAARYRDDYSRRRTNEKEDYSDIRSRSTKDQRLDAEKKNGSGARIDSVPDRGRSTSRNADVELNSGHNRRRSSPNSSSVAPRDHYRLPKQDESKYRDYNYEERLRHNMITGRDYAGSIGGSEKTSSSRSQEKHGQKEDGHLGDLSSERRLKSDLRSPPLQLVDKSPSSTDRRQFSRSDIRRSIDVEESTHRTGGSRDVKEYSGKEGRGRRELTMDVLPGDELLQADADTLSASSPFTRNNHLSSSSKSFPPPPPPFRTVVDSPLILGSIEDDGRFKSNSRHRRSSDPNVGRMQGNAWRGVPSWPSPVANGFMPFPHAPPPVSFHSVMQPFPAPPMFGLRPSMDLNHPAPYHMPDADRFSGPGRPMGWRNPVDDSCPPLHTWDASNAVFRDESHIYGRPGWDHSRNLHGGRGWDATGDLWKGPNKTSSLEMPSSEKENNFVQNADEASVGQFIQSTQNEQTFPDQQAESADVNQPIYGSEINATEAPHISLEDTSIISKISKKDFVPLYHVYLSKLDISADLTEPELFNQCTGFSDMDHSIISDMDDFKILFIEEAAEAKIASHQVLNYSLSTPMDDSVFQKAMDLYKRQKDKFNEVVNWEKCSNPCKTVPKSDQEDLNAKDYKTEKLSSIGDMQSSEDAILPNTNVEATTPSSLMKVEECTKSAHQKPDLKSEEPVSTLDHVNMLVDLVSDQGPEQDIVKEKPLSVGNAERSDACLPSKVSTDGNIEELNLVDAKCDTLLNSDVCSEACEAMMPESVVSGSVNLSRIHHSPESTH